MASLKNSEIILILNVLEHTLKDGLPVDFALKRLEKIFGRNNNAEIIEEMRDRFLDSGKIAGAFEGVLPENFVEAISSCEKLGGLDVIMGEIKSVYELRVTLHKNVKKAVSYPIGVMIALWGLIIAIILFLMPYFQIIFKGINPNKVPEVTKMLFLISNIANRNVTVFLGVMAAIVVVGYQFIKRNYSLFYSVPMVRQIMTRQENATAYLLLALFHEAGINVQRVFSMVGISLVGPLKQVLAIAANEVESGASIPEAFEKGGLDDEYLMYLEVGELNSRLEVEYKRLSAMESAKMEESVKRLAVILNVAALGIAAVSILGIYAATILPTLEMSQAL